MDFFLWITKKLAVQPAGPVIDTLLFHVREICICEAAEYIKIWNSFNKRRDILVAGWDEISLLYRCVQDVSNRHCDKIPVLFGTTVTVLDFGRPSISGSIRSIKMYSWA